MDVKSQEAPTYQMLEGHCPPDIYEHLLRDSGLQPLEEYSNLIPGSLLLCVHIARKVEHGG